MLALSQSLPSYDSSASSPLSGSSSFAANSLADNEAQSFSPPLSFSQTLAGLQTDTSSNISAPVSFPPSALFQTGTPSYSTYSKNQNANPYADSSPSAKSDSSQSVQASSDDEPKNTKSADATSADVKSADVKSADVKSADVKSADVKSADVKSADATSADATSADATSAKDSSPAKATSTTQGVQKNPSPASNNTSQQVQSEVSEDTSTSLSADQVRALSGPSTANEQAAAAGSKASETGRQEPSKRHRKANEVAQTGGARQAPGDSVAATLLAAANSSGAAPATGGASPAAASGSTRDAATVTNKNNLPAVSTSPDALAFAVKLQSAGSAAAGPTPAGSAVNTSGAAPQTDDSAGDQGVSKFAGQLAAVTDAAQLSQGPASLHGGADLSAVPAASEFATAASAGGAQSSASSGTNSPQVMETDGTEADNASSPAPLRSMQVQINGQDNQRIDLQLVERAGTLSMSVRSPDSALNRSLQDHLPELMTKLADQPGQAEWWTPKTQAADGGNGSGSGGGNKEDSSGSQGQQSQTGQDSGKQQSGRQSNQPKWVEELAALGKSNTTRKETIWHQ